MDNKKISAEEARKQSLDTSRVLKRIYKIIDDVSFTEGATQLEFSLPFPADDAVKDIVKDLTEQGYKVSTKKDSYVAVKLFIEW